MVSCAIGSAAVKLCTTLAKIYGGTMQRKGIPGVIFSCCLMASLLLSATEPSPGLLGVEDLKRVVPASYFFRGQSASVQLRNTAGFRVADGKLGVAGLGGHGGGSRGASEKYQGFL